MQRRTAHMSSELLCVDCFGNALAEIEDIVEELLKALETKGRDLASIDAKLKRVRRDLRGLQDSLNHGDPCGATLRRRR